MKRKQLKLEMVAIAQRNHYEKKAAKKSGGGNLRNGILAAIAGCIFIPAVVYAANMDCPAETPAAPVGKYYAETTVVTEVDHAADLVCIRTATGNEYTFYGAEDWLPGDICSAIMNDCGTELVFDDEVIEVRYSGTADRYVLECGLITKI